MKYELEGYQKQISQLIIEKEKVGIFARMGCGKTLATLHSIYELMYNRGLVNRVLVIAPKRVAEYVWQQEIEKWEFPFSVAKCLGTAKQRVKALQQKADITIINKDNILWLLKNHKWEWDMLVVDESSMFKNYATKRFREIRKIVNLYSRCVLLTGTPAPKGYINLWSQIYLLDKGKRLSPTVTTFLYYYFIPESGSNYVVYSYALKQGAKEAINKSLSDICFGLGDEVATNAKIVPIEADMDTRTKNLYKKFKKDQLIEIPNGTEITAQNAGVLSNKLLQFASGAVYTEYPHYYVFHHAKMDLLQEIIDSEDGENILVFYNYIHERDRLLEWFEQAEMLDVNRWNQGKQPLALAHPASCGHGLNLQDGGHICVWFSPTFDLELFEQANARLARKGQLNNVYIYILLHKYTRDEVAYKALKNKGITQQDFIDSVKLDLGLAR